MMTASTQPRPAPPTSPPAPTAPGARPADRWRRLLRAPADRWGRLLRGPADRRGRQLRGPADRWRRQLRGPADRWRRLLRGPADQPRWARPALLGLLALTALLYLWNLSASGYANSFYAAAAQAGAQSWKAMLFGALDSGGAITVDKPPAAIWVMSLSARIFGFSSWSILAPQALAGVAAVGLLYATVRRQFGAVAGLLAGAVLALTPVAVLMFRFDNPDALLVLLLVAAAYCTVRATERARPGWLALAGVAVGFAFLTKMMQGFLVVPALVAGYALAAPTSFGRRVRHLLLAGAALVASAGWFVALVSLWPAGSRPYIGGSTNNSLWQLALGYNGLSRILGGAGNGGGPGGGAGGTGNTAFGGAAGITRLFGTSMGAEISWLLPAALILLVGGFWVSRRAPRTDPTRAAMVLWGGWLIVSGLVFSYMSGTVHPYYTVALAPAIGALVAVGTRQLWLDREHIVSRSILAAAILATAVWSYGLLARVPTWLPALRWGVLLVGLLTAAAVLAGAAPLRRAGVLVAVLAVLSGLAGTAGYAVATAASPHAGSIPVSGPAALVGTGMGGGPGGARTGGGAAGGGTGQGAGGQSDSALATLLAGTDSTWAAAVTGATGAANLELASGKAVIAIGGWNGGDPAPTLAQFQQYVADGRIRYLVADGPGGMAGGPGGMAGGPGGMAGGQNGTSSQITSWVAANFSSSTVGGSTVYDLTRPVNG